MGTGCSCICCIVYFQTKKPAGINVLLAAMLPGLKNGPTKPRVVGLFTPVHDKQAALFKEECFGT